MLRRVFALFGGGEEYVEVIFYVLLADIFLPARRTQGLVQKTSLFLIRGRFRGSP
jgi:hypothetical protein